MSRVRPPFPAPPSLRPLRWDFALRAHPLRGFAPAARASSPLGDFVPRAKRYATGFTAALVVGAKKARILLDRFCLAHSSAACTGGSRVGSEVAAGADCGRWSALLRILWQNAPRIARPCTFGQAPPGPPQGTAVRASKHPVRKGSHMKRRPYRIPSLVTSLLGLI